jgi:hypothetical protein
MYGRRGVYGPGYPRNIAGYVAGADPYGYYGHPHYYPGFGVGQSSAQQIVQQAAAAQAAALAAAGHMVPPSLAVQAVPVVAPPAPQIVSPPWRPMMAPGSPPLGEGHVFLPLTAETFGGTWGGAAGAPAGTLITFSGRPQKPYKTSRVLARGTKVGATAVGNLIGQSFVGTDLQQGELGLVDLETIGAGGSFDTWVSWKQAEPGVWIRTQATLTAFPTPPDFETYTITLLGHYLH